MAQLIILQEEIPVFPEYQNSENNYKKEERKRKKTEKKNNQSFATINCKQKKKKEISFPYPTPEHCPS